MNVLIADDNLVTQRALEAALTKWGYSVIKTVDGIQALEVLRRGDAPKLAVLDWMMPGMDGIDVCREVRKLTDRPYTYMLLLTAKDQTIDVIEGLESGADDYLTKPFNAHELKARLASGRRIVELHEKLAATQEELLQVAAHDALTGLWNRGAVLVLLDREMARSRREGESLGVLLADIDHFKRINDTLGHLAGDAVLREVSQRMTVPLRSYDTIGRYGGEEFLAVLPGCAAGNAVAIAERLREGVSKTPIDLPEGEITVTVSIGTVVVGAGAPVEEDTLLRAVDMALYRAKNAGRNRVELGNVAENA